MQNFDEPPAPSSAGERIHSFRKFSSGVRAVNIHQIHHAQEVMRELQAKRRHEIDASAQSTADTHSVRMSLYSPDLEQVIYSASAELPNPQGEEDVLPLRFTQEVHTGRQALDESGAHVMDVAEALSYSYSNNGERQTSVISARYHFVPDEHDLITDILTVGSRAEYVESTGQTGQHTTFRREKMYRNGKRVSWELNEDGTTTATTRMPDKEPETSTYRTEGSYSSRFKVVPKGDGYSYSIVVDGKTKGTNIEMRLRPREFWFDEAFTENYKPVIPTTITGVKLPEGYMAERLQ